MFGRRLPLRSSGLFALMLLSGCRFDGTATSPGDGQLDQGRDVHQDASPGQEGRSPDAPAAPVWELGDGRLLFGRFDDGDLHALRYQRGGSSWLGDGLPLSAALRVHWVRAQLTPSAELAAVKATDGKDDRLWLLAHAPGADWKVEAVLPVTAENLEYRDYGLAIEGQSGNALLVRLGGASGQPGQLVSQRRVLGSWSAPEAILFPDGEGGDLLAGTVRWVELVSHAGSDHVALLAADHQGSLVATVWDGATWGAPEPLTKVLAGSGSGDVGTRAFDAAFSESGQLLVAWGRDDENGLNWATRAQQGLWSGRPALLVPAGKVGFVDLEVEPNSDRIAAVFLVQNSTERLGLGIWDGLNWIGADEYSAALRDLDGAQGDFTAAVGWSGGHAVAVYPGLATGQLDWYSWSPLGDGRWQPGIALSMPNKGVTESVLLGTSVDPAAELLAVVSDQHGALHGARFDGAGWRVLQSGKPLVDKLPRSDTLCFDLARR